MYRADFLMKDLTISKEDEDEKKDEDFHLKANVELNFIELYLYTPIEKPSPTLFL